MNAWLKSLALVLAVLQARPCSDFAVFLCWAHDGSFCVDAGPDHCTSCAVTNHHDEELAACCGHHHDDEQPVPSLERLALPCDCLHIQLSQQRPTVAAPRSLKEALKTSVEPTAGDLALVVMPESLRINVSGLSPTGTVSKQAVTPASTRLRC